MKLTTGMGEIYRIATAFLLCAAVLWCATFSYSAEVAPTDFEKLTHGDLPNAIWITGRVMSGGQPSGEPGFEALRRLGVRTVISVDGAKPNVTVAKQFGLRYVHLPHGYDGISPARVKELAKAVSELPGPIYIHCHHGKHRSPAAAAVACIGAGTISSKDGEALLKLAGTSPDYRGLYEVVANAERLSDLNAIDVEFQETVEVPPMATSMVQIERTFDNLKRIQKSGWKAPASHPDLSPEHEALLLREHFAELLRTEDVLRKPLAFQKLIEESRNDARRLENALRETTTLESARSHLSKVMLRINGACKQCHREFRD